ncbi:hypothetical protein [Clostridium formicaceticum]|uniref:Uncharacterized protein n=1 Tax=Clostridium formicaceticum TaxID=1497 RepID=A0AAC9WID0_9CLOT|nr:hypothetical protein [Clostridium formicaceticum]AOY75393.1 hypothetical protein BJL90_05440 [Clostridium formicaceticum]ARE89848.1 hypothetical protein CLFO_43310 [Clostridium formicaceticum]
MNNYMVILESNESMFIQTNTGKEITAKILTRYFLLKQFNATCKSVSQYFIEYGYIANEFIEVGISLYNTLASKNYKVIDLSKIKQCIQNQLLSN